MSATKRIRQHVDHEDSKHFHMDWKLDQKGKVHGGVVFPHTYVKVKTRGDLEDLLDYYGHSSVWQELIPSTRWARLCFVERVRPSLRFYCEKYQVPIPAWLKDDKQFTEMAPSTQKELFGVSPIVPINFKKLNVQPLIRKPEDAGQ